MKSMEEYIINEMDNLMKFIKEIDEIDVDADIRTEIMDEIEHIKGRLITISQAIHSK